MRALDPDGVTVVTAGTIGFAIGIAVCWWSYPQLLALGKGWYLGVAITGTVIGVLGLAFSLFRVARRRKRRAGDAPEDQDTLPEAPPRRALEEQSEDATPSV